jgi:hypothetical protein
MNAPWMVAGIAVALAFVSTVLHVTFGAWLACPSAGLYPDAGGPVKIIGTSTGECSRAFA